MENKENMALKSSFVQDSTVNTDAYKCGPQSVMANNSPIQQLIINNLNFHGGKNAVVGGTKRLRSLISSPENQTGRPNAAAQQVKLLALGDSLLFIVLIISPAAGQF
jgi:hypothetical protein